MTAIAPGICANPSAGARKMSLSQVVRRALALTLHNRRMCQERGGLAGRGWCFRFKGVAVHAAAPIATDKTQEKCRFESVRPGLM